MAVMPLVRAIRTSLGRGRGEQAYFDPVYYRAANADIAAGGVDPFTHFMAHGWREGRNPSATFSTLFYRDFHLGGAERNPLSHYLEAGGRSSGRETAPPTAETFLAIQRTIVADLFDLPFYTTQTGKLEQDPILHYLTIGWKKGFSPSPSFDAKGYADSHAFLGALGVSPFYHFASSRRLGRGGDAPSNAPGTPRHVVLATIADEFDRAFYLAQYSDVRKGHGDPLAHFVDHGWRERRNPTPLFDTAFYLKTNKDVAASNDNPFYHYLVTGRREGRRSNPIGSHLYARLQAPAEWTHVEAAADTQAAECVVIMPVYKGYDETLAAIHAVLSSRQRTRFALHVINDVTPDAALDAKLAELAARKLFSYVRNETNIGFVKSCNRGLRAFPDVEVVLLNADAVVSGDWLDRMLAHARHDPSIATVTPLSNNATICSYPVVNGNNLVEPECSAAELDALAAACNAGRRSDVPTGVGFCFLMSRAGRDAVGILDEVAFGRGYGEENDYCLRAAKAGFRNVLAEDIFVYHAGQVSFAELAASEYAPGQAALIGKHPDYPMRVRQHLRTDPGLYGRMRLDLARLARFAGQNSIVFISHALGGGITTHIRHMERRLRAEGIQVVHLRVGVTDRWSVEIGSDAVDAPFCPNLSPTSFHQLRPLLDEFLSWLSPLAFHLHSLVGFDWSATTGIMEMVERSGRPFFFTLHDYSVVCHRNDLVLTNGNYCGLPAVETCRICVGGDRSYPESIDPAVRRQTFDRFLHGATAVFAPSQDIAERLAGAGATYPIVLRPHEEDGRIASGCIAAAPDASRDGQPEPIRVATVGAIGAHKGSQVILNLARDAQARQLPISFHIVGYSDLTDDLEEAGVTETGAYKTDEEAMALLAAIDPTCVFLPSIWPETFCFALSIAFDLQRPPVVFDLGAQRDRVEAAGFGFVVPTAMIDDVQGLNDMLCALPFKTMRPKPPLPIRYGNILTDYYGLQRAER